MLKTNEKNMKMKKQYISPVLVVVDFELQNTMVITGSLPTDEGGTSVGGGSGTEGDDTGVLSNEYTGGSWENIWGGQ